MKPCWYCNSDGTPCQACDERQDLCADLSAAADQIERMQADIERLRAENAAFRNAIRTGDGPSCEDVCLVECVGVCGITIEEHP